MPDSALIICGRFPFSGYSLQECAIRRESGTLDLLFHRKSITVEVRALEKVFYDEIPP
jgi:hypothetical protein